ncbi:Hypothetical predicted protein [Paramuricea clavata]|uniref:Uncharacterized protein n=1 Tax=Paramuricea clavata TaxID=317549 RepID=A0A6S7HLS7_PARCT|nr:Hypothetical predicted protein [Paramuricea clavata]
MNASRKQKGKKRQNAPWINKELISLCRKKKLLYKKAKQRQNESTWIRYRQMNNNLKRKYNEARWRYITDLAQDLTDNNNPKPFWNSVKSKCKGTNKLISLKVGESVFTDDQDEDETEERDENVRSGIISQRNDVVQVTDDDTLIENTTTLSFAVTQLVSNADAEGNSANGSDLDSIAPAPRQIDALNLKTGIPR